MDNHKTLAESTFYARNHGRCYELSLSPEKFGMRQYYQPTSFSGKEELPGRRLMNFGYNDLHFRVYPIFSILDYHHCSVS